MARRAASDEDTDSSQKENVGPSTQAGIKAEKVKEKVKLEKKRVEPEDNEEEQADAVENDDDEEDAEGDEEEEEGEGSPKGHKRTRLNDNGDSHPIRQVRTKERVTTLPRDDDGFIPGSIVRIQLRNFVTYDWVEFCPGPYLNMILGPNGTGKSTIACAICIGLNWPPQVLGRALELNQFVKTNTPDGHIELELKGAKGKPNLTIRRCLSANSKSTTFTLNGHSATGKEISSRMAELNVQVGNLCSFLPQDKVSEFAQMSPQQLLRETQRAAGDEKLTSWHDTLISSGRELKQLNEQKDAAKAQLATMKERNETLERDVERYMARRKIEREIALLEISVPVQEYRECHTEYKKQKVYQRELHARVTALKRKNEPAHAYLKELGAKLTQLNKIRDQKKEAVRQKMKQMQLKWRTGENMEEESERLSSELQNLKTAEKGRLAKIKSAENRIVELRQKVENPPPVEKEEVVVEENKRLMEERNNINAALRDVQDRQKANVEDSSKENHVLESAKRDLQKLEDVNEQKLSRLRAWDRDTAEAVQWLRAHKHLFKMEVFEPPMMCLNVTDRRFTNAVEACFNGNQLKSFVAQCQEDSDTLNYHINDSEGLGRKARISVWFRPLNEENLAAPPLNEEELSQLGFDGYAIQYVDCPEGMKWFLKMDMQLHRTAIGLDGRKVDVTRAMEAVSRIGPRGMGGGANFVAGMTMNIVQRSRYGSRAPQNMTREVRQARNLTASTVDKQKVDRLQAQIKEATHRIEVFNEEAGELNKEYEKVRAEGEKQSKKMAAIAARRQAVRDAAKNELVVKKQLETQIAKLEELKNEPPIKERTAKLNEAIFALTKNRIKLAHEYTQLIHKAIADQTAATRITLEVLQVSANRTALQELCNVRDDKYQRAVLEFNEVDTRFKKLKAESAEKLAVSRAAIADVEEDIRAEYRTIEEAYRVGTEQKKAEQLRVELQTKQYELEQNMHSNPGVVEQYERRKKEIEGLEGTIEEKQKKTDRIEKKIKDARDNWEPALRSLVDSIGQKFSAAFDRIGCAGEIRVSPHEDYEKWAIDILVKFRDKEKLQLLTGQRQSGGERSLTTILYLMSLSEEARAPFSLVDEINQGMDQRAERAVHDSLVDVTCKASSAQYFLITPKLLPDLKYHERMKVLCVNNGEWLPEDRVSGNLMNMINNYVNHLHG